MENSKTPQFDALLDPVLDALVPHIRTCIWKGKHPHCEGDFEITKEDIDFLRMLRAPAPNYCPICRRMRRQVHMNMMRLFKRPCNIPGHTESMISIMPAECPFPVYEYNYLMGESFDAFSYGRDWNKDESPMEQLFSLRKIFPMPSFLNRDPSSVNSDYSNGGRDTKNAYYAFGCYSAEDVWYSGMINKSKEIMDSMDVHQSDNVYEGVCCDHIYKSSFVFYSKDCSDSMFLFDCKNCSDCFGCVNLRNKRYCIWNEQKTKEEYVEFMTGIQPFSHKTIEESKKRFWELVKSEPMNATKNVAVENCTGTLLDHCKNLYDCTHSDNSENVRHADGALGHHDSMDLLFSGSSERVYQTTNIGSRSSNVKFSVSSKFITDCEFVFNSKNLSNCFMCFGLQNKSYCVLNKQYTPEEYWPLVDAIKTEMWKRGEWGECPDMNFSAQAYNFSMAANSFPLTREQVAELGGYWAEEPDTNVGNTETIPAGELPETIKGVDDSILQKAIICEKTGRPFRIIASELAFYRKRQIPLPHEHPIVRTQKHFYFLPDGKNYKVNCDQCGKNIESVFSKEDGYVLYCESCYQKDFS